MSARLLGSYRNLGRITEALQALGSVLRTLPGIAMYQPFDLSGKVALVSGDTFVIDGGYMVF